MSEPMLLHQIKESARVRGSDYIFLLVGSIVDNYFFVAMIPRNALINHLDFDGLYVWFTLALGASMY